MTKNEIVVAYYLPEANQAQQSLLAQVNPDATTGEYDVAVQAFAKFFKKRYTFYGRRLKMITCEGQCDLNDIACWRNDARTLTAKHKPFAVLYNW